MHSSLFQRLLFMVPLMAFAPAAYAQTFCARAGWVKEKMMTEHLRPVASNDTLSARIFERFFDLADVRRIYFTKQDISSLNHHRTELANDINSGKCQFVNEVKAKAGVNIAAFGRFADSLLSLPMQFSEGTSGGLLGDTHPLANDRKMMKVNWASYLKSEVLGTIFRQHLFSGGEKELSITSLRALELPARERVKKKLQRSVQATGGTPQALETFLGETLLRSIPQAFDPHSQFFTQPEMASFIQMLSPEELSFGVQLEEGTLGELKVSRMVPGGPAWKSNQVNQGDVIIELESGNERHDFFDLNEEEANELLRSQKLMQAQITFRKPDGGFRKVDLAKAKVNNTENIVFSLILKGEKNIGYINLPGFFSATEVGLSNGCAGSVIQEVIKLKREKIDGLILDLRYNGGGDVKEAIDLAGAFIDVGPVGIFENKAAGTVSLRDMNRGSAYGGPLIIMVNGASASASEMVAAALQDYNRALVVGTTTYGKATAQFMAQVHKTDMNSGFLKITDERLYRINGKTTQQRGVLPDVIIPDLTTHFVEGERTLKYTIQSDSTNKKVYYQPLAGVDYTELRKKSAARISSSERFTRLSGWQKFLSQPFPAGEKQFCDFVNEFQVFAKNGESTTTTFVIANAAMNLGVLEVDQYQQSLNKKFIDEISSSMFVEEAYLIMLDFLQSNK